MPHRKKNPIVSDPNLLKMLDALVNGSLSTHELFERISHRASLKKAEELGFIERKRIKSGTRGQPPIKISLTDRGKRLIESLSEFTGL